MALDYVAPSLEGLKVRSPYNFGVFYFLMLTELCVIVRASAISNNKLTPQVLLLVDNGAKETLLSGVGGNLLTTLRVKADEASEI